MSPRTRWRLFRDRAAEHAEGDDVTIRRICERLDGIPLAIEFAAACTLHLSLEDIADRLDDRFRLLTGGRRRVQRQQTLQAALDWSHDLLTPDERTLLRSLAVFNGPIRLDALEGICGHDHPDVISVLGSLVERSMVSHDPGERRYRLLETVRLYAEQKLLDAGEAGGVPPTPSRLVSGGRLFTAARGMLLSGEHEPSHRDRPRRAARRPTLVLRRWRCRRGG